MKFLHLLFSIIIAAGTFFAFHSIFEMTVLLSSLFAAGGLIGAYLFSAPKKIDKELKKLEEIHGISISKFKRVIKKGRKKVTTMKRLVKKVENESMKNKILNIIDTAQKIFEDFKYDPKDIKAARQFLNYYLDATVKIIEQYLLLSKKDSNAKDSETLKNAEEVMDKIDKAFEKQLSKLYEDDFIDLDTEVSLLKSAVKSEGL